jgi:hypothetical protein
MTMRWGRVVSLLAGCAAIGIALFAAMAWRATSTDVVESADALQRLDALRAQLGAEPPILGLEQDGTVRNRVAAPDTSAVAPLSRIVVFVYRADTGRLIRTRIPFWFFRIKAPAADYALEGTGLSFQKLGITADDLQRYGPRVVVDHRTLGGGRLLVWTE